MTEAIYSELEDIAKSYYDSNDAYHFYDEIWGGEDIHVGIYNSDNEDISTASKRTVTYLASKLPQMNDSTRVLDIGSGMGGPARYLAKQHGCFVDCANISARQNEANRTACEQEGLSDKVSVYDTSFENLPFDDSCYDVVWAQDCIVHSGRRERVVSEAARVLKPGGHFLFTDLMMTEGAPHEVMQPVLARIHLDSMGSYAFYREIAEQYGLELVEQEDMTHHMATHYRRVKEELLAHYSNLARRCSKQYLDNMVEGLDTWIEAADGGHICWGILNFSKPL
ncbi:MAG: methyltransferase domain-containing protein [Sulfuriflexus sp.]|nr:methyltransferase domain-containing protein [Sulfuriflexus sp.]